MLGDTLGRVPARVLRENLLVLAASLFPAIRALAARTQGASPGRAPDLGQRLADDPAGAVRRALARALLRGDDPVYRQLRSRLGRDSRFTVREAAASGTG
ncbi:hypothetical protein KCV87_32760 [Actinosynnema pretiosum subsp. pretiosum]|uniref:Uncharacterized protein n=1 Tax=Actinosynnema pretiosum subsp. pretiosum TaxID=103721 RepID=A0AA45LEC0_9PSEU|nr:hypothetical protein KCV87_32760 [Actinosynnema pretiosum subsp. pretiosum]